MFSDNLKRLRQEAGLNKKQAAIHLNLPYTTYNNYETGSCEPNSEVLVKIANAFQVSTDYLLDNISFKGKNIFLNEEEQIIISRYREMPESIRDAIRQMLEATYRYWRKTTEQEDISDSSADIKSTASLYHSDPPYENVAQNIVVAAYGDGVHTHTCSAEQQQNLQKAQKKLNVDMEILKRRDLYGK